MSRESYILLSRNQKLYGKFELPSKYFISVAKQIRADLDSSKRVNVYEGSEYVGLDNGILGYVERMWVEDGKILLGIRFKPSKINYDIRAVSDCVLLHGKVMRYTFLGIKAIKAKDTVTRKPFIRKPKLVRKPKCRK